MKQVICRQKDHRWRRNSERWESWKELEGEERGKGRAGGRRIRKGEKKREEEYVEM